MAKRLLRMAVPQWAEVLQHLEECGGRLEFRSVLPEVISRLKIESYPKLYESELSAGKLLAIALLGAEGAREADKELVAATPEARGEAFLQFGDLLASLEPAFDFDMDDEAKAEQLKAFEALSPEEQQESMKIIQHLLMAFLAIFFEQLSIMVHGEKLTALVARAKEGNDDAFLKAIQIDKRILSRVDHFDARFQRAHMEGERSFITKVSRKLEAPPYAGRLKHKKLWMSFALLDWLRLLDDYSGDELLDLCIEVGAIDDEQPIEDVKNLLKLRARYREFQQRGGKSTP